MYITCVCVYWRQLILIHDQYDFMPPTRNRKSGGLANHTHTYTDHDEEKEVTNFIAPKYSALIFILYI